MSERCPRCAKLAEPLVMELRNLRADLVAHRRARDEILTLERLLDIATAIAEITLGAPMPRGEE